MRSPRPSRSLNAGVASIARAHTWAVALALGGTISGWSAPAGGQVRLKAPGKQEPPAAVGDLMEWLTVEQLEDGGWNNRLTRSLPDHLHARTKPKPGTSYVADTAVAALALLRTGNTPSRGTYRVEAKRAADYLYAAAGRSGPGLYTANPAGGETPFSARVGPQIATSLTLLYFAELRDPVSGIKPYDGEVEHLVRKLEQNQRPDGGWGTANHAPLLGHAVSVWALESAVRHGMTVDPAVLLKAELYAMSELAERDDHAANGKWKAGKADPRPEWLKREGVLDDEPVDSDGYVMAARLSVLYQADRTNRWAIDREWDRLKAKKAAGQAATDAQLEALKAMLLKAKTTKVTLDKGRDDIRASWAKVHKLDLDPSPAPVLFTAEDFLADLLVVDAMADAPDVAKWFLPMARRLISLQDADGGLRTDQHILCSPRCPRHGLKRMPLQAPVFDDPQMCMWQRAWCSRDRTFITAVGLSMLAADSPYRATVLNPGPGAAAKPAGPRAGATAPAASAPAPKDD
ncbi:MAG: hypothetical protein JWO31_2126 [Phycisphaerales bacterium]|nr:hypothetical protein [Phycisphaerales bacterium]